MKSFTFHIPTKIIFGPGKIQELDSQISNEYKNILIVTDVILLTKTEIISKVKSILNKRNVFIFSEVEENPTFKTIEKGAQYAKSNNIDLILGIGGGSSMDAAKGIAIKTLNEASIKNIVEGHAEIHQVLPIICIPTSSGTGSEVTPFAVFTDSETHLKMGYSHPNIFPIISLIDPELTYSMPAVVIINTGLDALAHSIEAYLSKLSFELNDQLAIEAIRIIIENLENASKKNKEAMNKMAYAAMLGGVVISHASTILPHIMGYPLTSYHGLAHGRACIILQPAFINYLKENNLEAIKTKIIDDLFILKGGLESFIQRFNISTRLSNYGIKKSEISNFSKQTIVKGDIKITPGIITENIITDIYLKTL